MGADDETVPVDEAPGAGTGGLDKRVGRRSPRVAVSAAVAGLLLLTGAAYELVRTSDGGGTSTAGGSGASASATRDTRKAGAGEPGPGTPSPPTPPSVRVVYHVKKPLPQGPQTAPVYRADRKVTEAQMARLARALGVTGMRDQGDFWSNPARDQLTVQKDQWGAWAVGIGPSKSTRLIDESRAKATALPVLAALGQTGAILTTAPTPDKRQRVTADPVIDGLPTFGWTTTLSVDGDGRVTGSGHVGLPRRIGELPVTSALTALTRNGAQIAGPGVPPEMPGWETRHVTVRSVRLILVDQSCPAKGDRLAPGWEFVGHEDGAPHGAAPYGKWFEEAVPPEDPNECL
ncbi:hypothetical protein GCM10011579_053570 [Streptomyces albiflavescens]|uniref:Uncharacterized protein n=1 Tax=Streptomyces albiflavescens TaxID=1623582 RepID=A0A917Y8U3_9ACTN|nr:hypothetical protein [Streptomyces albiflavescens]GGN74479.1 hypothetical protein GCM10011579_053570 [Streptomyces albiflavescens]